MKKRVLISYYDFGIGGSTTSLLACLNHIDYNLYDVDLCVYENTGDLKQYVNPNVNIIEVKNKPIHRISLLLYGLFSFQLIILIFSLFFSRCKNKKRKFVIGKTQIAAKYRAKKSKIIKDHYDFGIGYLEFWANEYIYLLKNVDKKIYWIHSDYELSGLNLLFDRKKFNLAHRIVFVAEQCVKNFNALSKNQYVSKVIEIRNLLDKKTIHAMSEEPIEEPIFKGNEPILLSVLRMDLYTKGLDRCIEVAKILKEKNIKLKWVFVGEGPDFNLFQNLVLENELQNLIVCIGKKNNPYKYMKASNLLVMLSRYEGKPMVVDEAIILQLYCILTEYSSIHGQIIEGKTGSILPNGDAYDSQFVVEEIVRKLSKN